MGQVYTSPGAQADLHDYWSYILDKSGSEEIADRWIESIHRAAERYALNPEMGELRRDLRLNLRSFSVGSYVVFFPPATDGIELMQIIHGARDVPRHLRRD